MVGSDRGSRRDGRTLVALAAKVQVTSQMRASWSSSSFTTGTQQRHREGQSLMMLDAGDIISPMVTHLHVAKLIEKPLQRIRSRSFGDYQDRISAGRERFSKEQFILPLAYGQPPQPQSQSLEDTLATSTVSAEPKLDSGNPIWISILYGLINAVIVLPVLMSFGSIIYRDDAFMPYMPVLIKLTVVSGMVHQICFAAFSSLPFAVGQVQDAGLIFLSSMARSIVQYCQRNNHDDEALLATVTIGLGIATALLGLGLIVVGKCRLAQYVQHLPTCVIGGYLAFIGWFCGMSGLELMAGGGDISIPLITHNLALLLPGIGGGIFIYVLVRRLRHMAVLPACIAFLFVAFYVMLLVTNTTVAEVTDRGWIRKSDPPPVWYHTWDYLKLDKVVWAALPSQILTLFSMTFVVALSSSLDVAAIELELKQPLDYNHELTTVGISNVVSGLTGGYTGSYIFSQSIFSLRAGIRSRLAGCVLALCELVVLILPFPILSYVPNFFFGSLLIMICIDLMHEWLWDVRAKVTKAEYGVCLGTFALIQGIGVEYGIIAGVGVYLLCRQLGMDVGESNRESDTDEEVKPSLSLKPQRSHESNYGAT